MALCTVTSSNLTNTNNCYSDYIENTANNDIDCSLGVSNNVSYLKSTNSDNDCPLNLMLLNLQSILSEKEVFWEMLDSYTPDIVAACETWLTLSILDSEIFPAHYTLYRTDFKDGYGGVLIGVLV